MQGVEVPITYYPHVALITYKTKIKCGGSIISERVILTAAHCFTDVTTVPAYHVYLGSSRAKAGAKYRVCKILKHKDFIRKKHFYVSDVALVLLRSKIRFGKRTNKIEIVSKKSHWRNQGHPLTFASFGIYKNHTKNNDDIRHMKKLKATTMLYVDSEACGRPMTDDEKQLRLLDSMFCMTTNEWTSIDCHGDSGSGVIWKYEYLVGIVSRSKHCGSETKPSLYTNVLYFKRWIRRHVKYLESLSLEEHCPVKLYKDYKSKRWVPVDH